MQNISYSTFLIVTRLVIMLEVVTRTSGWRATGTAVNLY